MTADVPDNSPAAAAATSTRSNSSFLKSGMARLLLGVAAGILFCGCHKKSEAQAPPPETAPAPTTAAAATPAAHGPVAQPLPASSQTIAANATADEVAGQLTLELSRYVAYTRNIPKSFEDFVAHDPVKFPPPPPGKKYVITGGQIILQ